MSATKSTAAQTQIKKAKSGKMARLLTSTTLAAAGLMAMGAPANADNWTDHVADVGNISIDTSIANTTNISTGDNFVKVRGDGDINAGWTVNVMQPNVSSKYVLYDIEVDPTMILGTLNANGEIYIFDEQGTIFGTDSVVNVGGLIASTGFISDSNIQSGNLLFEGVNTGGSIVLNGSVTVAEGGLAAFVAPQVTNNGFITAKLGKVALASGDRVTVDLYGDNLIEIAVDDKATDGLIKNSGVIDAEGGVIAMSVQTAKAAVDDVINMGGVVNASSATVVGGKIVLSGGKQGTVKVANGAVLDASGKNGGGSVSVTGEVVAVDQETITNVDAVLNGNGGNAYFYGLDKTIFRGNVFAQGGAEGGNGGFVEVSAGNEVGFDGFVTTLAPAGEAGSFLIDPQYSVIHSGWLNNLLGFELFLSAEALARSMESNGMVTVQADNTIDVGTDLGWVPGVGGGDIDLSQYDYDTWGVTGTYTYWLFGWRTGYTYGWINHAGTTQANLTLDANTVNFNRNLTLGNGNLTVDANTVNLDAKIYGKLGGSTVLLGDSRISSNADRVNVESNNALVQQGVWLADDAGGAVVDVAAGTYNESVYINKSLTLQGANAGVSGTSASRDLNETILRGPSMYSLQVAAQNVTVDGLTIEGANSGAEDAVWTYNAGGLDFTNNRVLNAAFGVISWGGNAVQGNISDNLIANIGQHGVYIGQNQYFSVLNNTIGDEEHGVVRVGITTENFYTGLANGETTLIDGNKVMASRIGIRNNLSYGTQSGFQISNNNISAAGDIATRWTGIDVISQQAGVATLFKDNNIEGAGAALGKQSAGYEFTNMTNTSRAVVDGGSVKNTDVGVWVTDGSFYTGAVSDLLVKNVDFGYITKYGILVENTIDPSDAGGINVNTTGTKVTLGEGNTFTGTPYDLAIAGDVTVALEGTSGVNKTLVKAAGASNYVGAPSGTTAPQLYTTNASINTGIGATAAGGTVFVENGTFTENVVVNKALTLRSLNGRDATTIAGIAGVGALGAVVVTNDVNGATIGGTDVGFTIVGFDNGNPAVENAALYFQGNHAGATVRGNRITANGDEALVTEYNLVNSDFVIDDNIFDGKTYVGATYATTGNQFEVPNRPRQLVALNKGHSNLTFTNNDVVGDAGSNQLVAIESAGSTVTGNTFNGLTTSAALRVQGSNATIADNTLTGTGKGIGIWAQKINNATIGGETDEDGNTVSGFINGILVDTGTGTTLVQNNTTTGNTDTDAGRSASDWQTGIGIFLKNMLGTVTVADNTTTGNTDGIRVQDTDPTVVGAVTVSGNNASNNRDKGIILKRSDNIKVYDNDVNGNSIGIYADASRGALIQANDLNGNTADGIRLRDGSNNVRIENNWIHGSANGIYVDNSLATISGVTVYDNSFAEADGSQANGKNLVNTTNNLVNASFNWWGTTNEAAVAAKITGLNKVDISPYQGQGVDQQPATAGYQGNMGDLYVTDAGAQTSGLIQEAINAATEGGLVKVNAGTYTENLRVWKGLKLEGLDGATLRYDAANAGEGTAGNLITVTANNVNIDPFTFDGLGLATYGTYANAVNGLTIDGNTYKNFTGSAIYLTNSGNLDIKNNVIHNVGGNGIRLDFVNGANFVTNNFIGYTNNTGTKGAVGNVGGDGILLLWGNGGSTTQVEGNDVTRTAGYGLNLIGSNDRLTVTLNDVNETGSHGIRLDNTNSAKIIDNDVTNVGGAGIHSTGAQALLVQLNTVNGTVGAGIHADNTGAGEVWGGPTIDQNTVNNTGSHGIEVVNVATRVDRVGSSITNNFVGTLGAPNNIGGNGIHADNVGRLAITGNTVKETSGTVGIVGNGIYVEDSNGALVGGAGLLRNTVTSTDRDGIKIEGGTGVVVDNNDVSNAGRVGIYGGNSHYLTIKNNIVNNTTWSIGAPYGGISADWGSNITVSDNTVSNSGHGVMLYLNGGKNTVSGNVIHNVSNDGVNANQVAGLTVSGNFIGYTDKVGSEGAGNNIGNDGVRIVSSDKAVVTANQIVNTRDDGVDIVTSNKVVVGGANLSEGNLISKAGHDGVSTEGGDDVQIKYNTITNTLGASGVAVHTTTKAKVVGNVITNANLLGVYGQSTDKIQIVDNVITNVGYGAPAGHPHGNGIGVESANTVTVKGNTVITARSNGISIGLPINNGDGTTTNVTVENNKVSGTGADGIVVGGGAVSVSGNTVNTTAGDGIDVRNSAGVDVKNNKVGYLFDGVTVGSANNIGGNGIALDNSANADVINNDIATALNGVVANLTNGLNVYDNDIVGRGSSFGTGVKVSNSSNVNVGDYDQYLLLWKTADRDNRISNFDTGVSITGGTKNDVVNNTVSNVHYGVKLSGTTYANVLDNSLTGNSVTGIDVVAGSHNATIQSNDITNFATGINVDASNDVKIGGFDVALLGDALFEGNNISNAKNGIVANNAQRLKIQGNRIEQGTGANGGSGIQLKGSSDDALIGGSLTHFLRLQANNITGFNDGIRLDNSDRAQVVDNKVEGAARDGIRIDLGDWNQIKGNKVYDVGSTGIWLNKQTNAVASGNRVDGTGLSGIRAEGSGSNHVDIINNRIDNTGTNGISAVGVADLDVLNNKIGENGGNIGRVGIYVENSSGAQIEENRVNNTGANGISVITSANARVLENKVGTLDGNINGDGILIDRSNGTWVKSNKVNDTNSTGSAVGSGISVKGSSNVEIGGDGDDYNTITNAEWDGVRVSGGDNVSVEENKITGVDRVGVWMSGTTNSNVLYNEILNTGLSGVRGEGGYNLTINRNQIDQTGTHGISANGVYGMLTIAGNQIGQNVENSIGSDGINVYDAEFVTIGEADDARNNISGAQNGIVVDEAIVVNVLNNNVLDVAYDGVRVTDSTYVYVNDNVVENAGDDGIEVGNANEARILRNKVTMTGDDGIVAYNIGNFSMWPTVGLFAEEGEGEGESEESGDYYALIISDNVITDAGQMYAGDDEGEGESEYEGEGEPSYDRLSQVQELSGDGIDVYNSASTLIEGNTVSNSYDDGIIVEGLGNVRGGEGSGDYLPKMLDYYGYEPALVVIRDNDVTDSGNDGIEVKNMPMSTTDINRVLNSGANGFLASGAYNGDVVLTGNIFTNNTVGARFESGLIDLTGAANTFNGGVVGMQFDPAITYGIIDYFTMETEGYDWQYVWNGEGYDFVLVPTTFTYQFPIYGDVPADLNLVNDTIGTTVFNGQSQYYVELMNGALFNPGTPTIINGLNASYDGFVPMSQLGILTQAQYNAIEAKIFHYRDLNSLGLFFFGVVPNNINDKDIYRAFAGFRPGNGPLSLTVTGLPMVPGFSGNIGNFLNSITPAAGGTTPTPPKPNRFATLVQQLAGLEPAAGGSGNQGGQQPQGQPLVGGQQQQQNSQEFGESTCWGDTMAAASGGTVVSMSFNSDPSSALAGAASCQTGI